MASFGKLIGRPWQAQFLANNHGDGIAMTELEQEEARLAGSDAEAYLRLANAMSEAGISSVTPAYLRKLAEKLRKENQEAE